MKILQITSRIPYPLDDGGAIGIYNITKALHEAGHHITLCALNTNKHYQPPHVMQNVCSAIHTVDINTDIRVGAALRNLFFSDVPYSLERFVSQEFIAMISRLVQTELFDVIHIDSSFVAYMVPHLRKITAIPMVIRAHNIEYAITERLAKNTKNLLKRWYYGVLTDRMKKFEQNILPQASGILAITPEDVERLSALGYHGAYSVMPAGVDTTMFAPHKDIELDTKSVFYFGSLDWAPNIEAVHWFMLHVFPALRKQIPDIAFHIGGKNPGEDILRYDTIDGVSVHANVPSAPRFMNQFHIMVVPLLSGGGMRLKIVEAMSTGTIIISTRIGAEGIAGVHGENMLFAETPEEFITCIQQCVASPELCDRLMKNARITAVQEYSWQGVIKKGIAFYESLIRQETEKK